MTPRVVLIELQKVPEQRQILNHINDSHMILTFLDFQVDIYDKALSTIEKFVLFTLKTNKSTLNKARVLF